MSWSYDPSLPTDRDWVRFFISDTVSDSQLLQDEEIDAVLSEETATGQSLKYFASARCLSILLGRWASVSQGVLSKTVSRLSITWGTPGPTLSTIQARIDDLRERGAWLITPSRGRPFRIAGGSLTRSRPQ